MKVSITGATGHLGNSLLPQLLAEGFSIKVVCRENTDLTPLLHMDLEIAIAELSSADSLSEAFKGSECVLHLASLISIMPFMKRSLERTSKYNRLLRIEKELGYEAKFAGREIYDKFNF